MIALVALIVCVMISAVVVYTAFSNVGRVKNAQGEEQNYLSVSSAVMLFKNSLEGDSVSVKETYSVTTAEICDNNWETLTTNEPDEKIIPGDVVYNDAKPYNTMLKDVLSEWAKTSVKQNLTVTIAGDSNLPNMAEVEAEVVFDPGNGKMIITFYIKDASPSAVDKYSTVMTMDLSKSTSYPLTSSSETKKQINGSNVRTVTVEKTFVHTISWDNCVITKKEVNTGG